jgi:predicted P-loop ATPase
MFKKTMTLSEQESKANAPKFSALLSEAPDPTPRDEIETYLRMFYEFKYNIVNGRLYYKPLGTDEFTEMTDYSFNSILRNIDKSEYKCNKKQLIEILISNFTTKYDPFKEYLDHLPAWDCETDHIGQWAKTINTTNNDLWELCFRKWIVGVAGSLKDAKTTNQTAPVFCGPQGIGKTRWISTLVPPCLKPYFFSGTIQMNNKDSITQLSECMIIDMDELENLNKRSIGDLKSQMSREQIRIRRPYGRIFENIPRRASFIGSINHKDFLKDETGSRRFLCFEVESMNPDHQLNVDQLYAQALVLYESDFQHWFNKTETELVLKNNEQFQKSSLEEEILVKHFLHCSKDDQNAIFMTASEITQILNKREKLTVSNATVQRIGKALAKHKFIRVKKSGAYRWAMIDLDAKTVPALEAA